MVLVRIEEGQGNAIGMLDSGAILMQSSVHCSFPACGTVSPNRDFVKVVQCAVYKLSAIYTILQGSRFWIVLFFGTARPRKSEHCRRANLRRILVGELSRRMLNPRLV
jgi:hypothetical protein